MSGHLLKYRSPSNKDASTSVHPLSFASCTRASIGDRVAPWFIQILKNPMLCWSSGFDGLTISLLASTPGGGLSQGSDSSRCTSLHIEGVGRRSFHLIPGSQIACIGDPIAPNRDDHWFLAPGTVACPRPELDADLACNFVHAFCGSFSGCSQAASFLSRAECGHRVGQQISIDQDDTVMSLWATKHGSKVYKAPIACQTVWNPSVVLRGHAMVHTSISDI